jgi:hypothetical protein
MYRLRIILILAWCSTNTLFAQYIRPENSFSVGYQYGNFENSLSQSAIELHQFNQSIPEGSNRFKNDRNAYGLVVRLMLTGNKGLISEIALGNKKVISKAGYFDSTANANINISTKQRFRYLSYGLHYAAGRFTFGASVDLGIFSSLQRSKGSGIEGEEKWHPWFYSPKLSGSGYTGKTPVIGWTLATSVALTQFTELRLYKQFTAFGMGADYSNGYFSMANWGVELAITLNNE